MGKFKASRIVTASAVALATAYSAPGVVAVAQETASGDDVVVVTGSRIARDPNEAAPVPIQSIDADDIAISGDFNLIDAVNDIPALISSTTTESSTQSGFANGANILNLRSLGANRTLTLINGRRSVAGVGGSAAVDIGSIPKGMVERVEVLTGGASAVYGADAVTGVVNFILKDDVEGLSVTASGGSNFNFDGEQYSIDVVGGQSFANGRGNVTAGVSFSRDSGLSYHEQDAVPIGGPASTSGAYVNPALRFQNGEINPTDTPNLADFYNFDNTGLFRYGLQIPSAADFIADYTTEFGTAPTLTAAEQALFTRAANAPSRTLIEQPAFSITSGNGIIIPGNPYTFAGFSAAPGIDTDGNGIDDCQESFVGYNSSFAPGAFGIAGGCYTVNNDGSLRAVRDGIVTGDFNGGGGDAVFDTSQELLLPEDTRINFLVNGTYDLTSTTELYGQLAYSISETRTVSEPPHFTDLLFGAPDNPFLPAQLQPLAQSIGGIAITIDPTIYTPGANTYATSEQERKTFRAVGGIKGQLGDNYDFDIAGTFGQFERESVTENRVVMDRFFAAIDVVSDPVTGDPVCRSTLDASALPPATRFGIPAYDGSDFYSFTPGAGSPCVPLNIWAGESGITQEAVDFITIDEVTEVLINQTVFSGVLTGTLDDFFTLPAGSVGFAFGGEYRSERSKTTFDPFREGITPAGSLVPGVNVDTLSDNESLLHQPVLDFNSSKGINSNFDVTEIFAEVSIPLLRDAPFAEELILDLAGRYSDYSTIGETTTWKVGLNYSPVSDVRFRATLSEAVRAPNIGELFDPEAGTTRRPSDPCSTSNVGNGTEFRQDNCVTLLNAVGIDPLASGSYAFVDPLSAAFPTLISGNPDLIEETARSYTLGFVLQPRFVDGLTLSVDYWDYDIDDGILTLQAQDVVDSCVDLESVDNDFCALVGRNDEAGSAQQGGFNFLRLQPLNLAGFEASGFDFALSYETPFISGSDLRAKLQGTKYEKYDRFDDPLNPEFVDPELKEFGRPEWAATGSLALTTGPLTTTWQTQYYSEQAESGIEIEDLADFGDLNGPIGLQDDFFRHDLSLNMYVNDQVSLFGGVNNVLDEQPFRTSSSYPVSPRGRYIYFGAQFDMP